MNKLVRLSPSGIEYLDYAWSFYSGCENWHNGVCPVGENCWAKKITGRFKSHYPNGFEPTYYPEAFLSPLNLKKPSRIGAGWMGDLFGDWVDPNMKMQSIMPSGKASVAMSLKGWIFTTIEQCPQHTFFFLTKCPQNLPKWSPFPSNCKVGVSATDPASFAAAYFWLAQIEAGGKYISLEPFYNWDIRATEALLQQAKQAGVEWLPIGAQTKPYKPPEIDWLEAVILAANKIGIKIFLKDNLYPLIHDEELVRHRGLFRNDYGLRQELPQ